MVVVKHQGKDNHHPPSISINNLLVTFLGRPFALPFPWASQKQFKCFVYKYFNLNQKQNLSSSINIFFWPTYLHFLFMNRRPWVVSMLVLPLSVYICFHAIISIIIITCYCYCSSTSVEYDAINLIIYLLTAFGKIAPLFCFFADELRNKMKCCITFVWSVHIILCVIFLNGNLP